MAGANAPGMLNYARLLYGQRARLNSTLVLQAGTKCHSEGWWGTRRSAEDWATDAATKLHHSNWTGNQVIKHTWGMVDIWYLYSVITHTDCSSSLVVIMDPQLHPWCLPHTFQISDWKLVEDTTCMKLDSLWWLDACVWPDSNESWTCGYGVVVFGWWTVSAETSVTWGGLTFGMIRIY